MFASKLLLRQTLRPTRVPSRHLQFSLARRTLSTSPHQSQKASSPNTSEADSVRAREQAAREQQRAKSGGIGSLLIKAGGFCLTVFLINEYVERANASSAVGADGLFHGFRIKFYMYHGCPFCAKVEAYLKYHGLPYERIEVNALSKTELKPIKKRWGYKKVPAFVMVNEETGDEFLVEDSQRVISLIESFRLSEDHSLDKLEYFLDKCYAKYERQEADENNKGKTIVNVGYDNILNIMYESAETRPTKEQIANNMKWRDWIEQKFLHVLAPNLYRTYGESIANTQHYISISPKFANTWTGSSIVYTGGTVMKIIGDKVKKRWNVSAEPRDDLYKYANIWADALPADPTDASRPGFMSGTAEPSTADLEMFGLITILEGTKVWPDLEQNSRIMPWYLRMRDLVSARCGQNREAEIFIAEHPNCGAAVSA